MEKKNRKNSNLPGDGVSSMSSGTEEKNRSNSSCDTNGRKRNFAERFSIGRILYSSRLFPRSRVCRPEKTRIPGGNAADFSDVEKGIYVENKVSSQNSEKFVNNSNSEAKSLGVKTNCLSECSLCLTSYPLDTFVEFTNCWHSCCSDCLQQYLRLEISEARVNVTCPECSEPLHPSDVKKGLDDAILFEKYGDFMVRRFLAIDPDTRWCPVPDCGYAVIASGCASCPKLKCERPGCSSYFCYHCKAAWHPNQTCDSARAERAAKSHPGIPFSHDTQSRDDIKRCPICRVLIVKMDDGSCNHMTCAVCGAEFCWLCMNVVGDLHYLSPSGCTFWGKKPWSRKKKILWQLGILVGAPVGIALIAGIAIPAIIIGVPIWTGRKMYTRFQFAKKCKRNTAVIAGVLTAIIAGPILASLAVCVGVPILLFYVYGVVPVSLCRSSGCGVSSSSSGIRFDVEDPEYPSANTKTTSRSTDIDAVSHKEGNPSIGEISLSLGSATHLEHLEREQDGESSSTVALAGSIIAHKLDTLADTAHNTAICSETASERSDTATSSTRGLHGSLLNYKTDAMSTCSFKLSNPEGFSMSVDQHSETNLSLSSLEELTASLVLRVRSLKRTDKILEESTTMRSDETDTNAFSENQPASSSSKSTSGNLLRSFFFTSSRKTAANAEASTVASPAKISTVINDQIPSTSN